MNKAKVLSFTILLLILFTSLKAQEPEQKPINYAMWGLVPGMGQFLLGNNTTGALQLGLFLSFLGGALTQVRRSDSILYKERKIQFKLEDVILADSLEKNGYLYKEYPFLSESQYDRVFRMIRYNKLIEINPFLEYGSYERKTYATTGEELFIQSAQHVMFYSVYSSYRDSGGIAHLNEDYFDLAIAPLNPRFLLNQKFIIPIGIVLLLVGYETSHPPKNPERTLLYPGMKSSGYMNFYTTVLSFNAGVGEEAFFRGFINHYAIQEAGFGIGLLFSSLSFGFAHLGNGIGNAIFATIFGAYLGYLHYKENWDIRQGIAIHFWWDIIAIGSTLRYMKEDSNVLKNSKEIFFMPISFQLKF
ncbi:MAG: CPBP family intramembrane glutamic endopeptidase [Leptonema sp. (in: bacteria)]